MADDDQTPPDGPAPEEPDTELSPEDALAAVLRHR